MIVAGILKLSDSYCIGQNEPELISLLMVCTVDAAKSLEYLPIMQYRNIRPVKGARLFDRFCAAKINGSSLYGDSIHDDDYAIARLTFEDFEVKDGQLVAVLTPNGMLIKHFYRAGRNRVCLKSSNPLYADLYFDAGDVVVQGIIVEIDCPHKQSA